MIALLCHYLLNVLRVSNRFLHQTHFITLNQTAHFKESQVEQKVREELEVLHFFLILLYSYRVFCNVYIYGLVKCVQKCLPSIDRFLTQASRYVRNRIGDRILKSIGYASHTRPEPFPFCVLLVKPGAEERV